MDTPPTNIHATAAEIARQLDETNPTALTQIELIVQHLGAEAALAFLQETLVIEARGGMMLPDDSRRTCTWPRGASRTTFGRSSGRTSSSAPNRRSPRRGHLPSPTSGVTCYRPVSMTGWNNLGDPPRCGKASGGSF
jgi:hypothetical protein